MQDRIGASRNKRPAYLANDEEFADLVEAWLDRHGLMSVPISAGGGAGGAVAATDGRRAPSARQAEYPATSWTDTAQDERLKIGPLEIDTGRRDVRFAGAQVHLTPTEFRLLGHLARNADRVVGHRELLRLVWGPGYDDELHLLQVTIRSLRGRVALVTDRAVVETVYGAGYRIADLQPPRPSRAGRAAR